MDIAKEPEILVFEGRDEDRTGEPVTADVRVVIEKRHFWLLAALVCLYLMSPLVAETNAPRLMVRFLFTLVMIAAAVSSGESRWRRRIAVWLAVPAIGVGWGAFFADSAGLRLVSDLAYMSLLGFTLFNLLDRITRVETSDFDTICGGVACYLLIGAAWALSYRVIEHVAPGSFSIDSTLGTEALSEYLYFSLTTMTTLGYGDITPLKPFARVWSALEAVTGTLFIALLIARLVGIYRRN